MGQSISTTSWAFDVSSFMVLVGESEEFRYRSMRRSMVECLTAAPVVGLQSYLHSTDDLLEATGRSYFSPFGSKHAPLRNMRLVHSIYHKKLLHDGQCRVYRVPPRQTYREWSKLILFWTMGTWLTYCGILAGLILHPGLSWIGIGNATIFVGWSIIVRLLERHCTELASLHTSKPDEKDAIFILGRRNSCFVLEGHRGDIAKWTGRGILQKEGRYVEFLIYLMRLGSLAVIIFVFITIPNGTTWDQVAFIAVNIIGQLNVLVGQNLAASHCFSELELKNTYPAPTRTHVYAFLLRKFGDGEWVDEATLLPRTAEWRRWRALCVSSTNWDAKKLYDHCLGLQQAEESPLQKGP